MIQELKVQNNNLTNTSRVELDHNESSGVESLIPQQNDTNYCNVETQENVNTNFVHSYQNLQLLFDITWIVLFNHQRAICVKSVILALKFSTQKKVQYVLDVNKKNKTIDSL